ncbi:cytochrome c biogenesis CcdA family protein [Pseudonocardia spinosispora]|uniref:cytochrome c biogenesis CcdA family protein n=1 Tax=Pseudonocardia spinosispora TaxID=103441 RepID=UPI00040BFDFA|nr:cytochrome c biogenesis CcdA family protein [Pseudonocardia spinosispora]
MTDIGYLAALLGGVLALLSPCSALLLPSFFAYAFTSRTELLGRTVVFYLGLATTLVPLGIGSTAVSSLFNGHRELLIRIAGWVIIAFGVATILGRGFTVGPAVRLQQRATRRGGWAGVFGLGMTYGLAGFCSGPILGAVLTIAAAGGQPLRGAALLAVYALGMAVPLFALAALWQRFDLGGRRWLRGREFTVGRLVLHTTSTVSGLLFIVVGVLFLVFDGTAALGGMLGLTTSAQTQLAAQSTVARWAAHIPDVAVLGVLAVIIVAVAARRSMRR